MGSGLDPDPAFYFSAYPDPNADSGSQTNADACESGFWSDFQVTKSGIVTRKKISLGNRSKNIHTKAQNFYKCQVIRFIC